MHKMTIFPLGNADCCRIELECGRTLLFDYADKRNPEDESDLRCDLPKELRAGLEQTGRDSFDIVAFTHLDQDHFQGSSNFFYLEHSPKYQTAGRIKMEIMWVPAGLITEKGPDDEEAKIIQKEARYRFKEGKGIRVFSRPDRLAQWCKDNDISLQERLSLITDAGKLVPELTLDKDGAEVFVHSPFAVRQDESTVIDRNGDSIVVQVVFQVSGVQTKALLMADTPHDALADIVSVTKAKGNEGRLEWDISKLAHHCSYLSLGPDKGEDKTVPVENVAWLYETKGLPGGIIVSTSKPIPINGSEEDEDQNPPHRQAANYYRDILKPIDGQFIVTMEHPSQSSPKPLAIEIGADKATVKKQVITAAFIATSTPAPRAG